MKGKCFKCEYSLKYIHFIHTSAQWQKGGGWERGWIDGLELMTLDKSTRAGREFFGCQLRQKILRYPLPSTSCGSPDHLATWTLAYTHSSSLGSALCRGLFEILTWPYSTSWSTVCCGTRLPFRILTSAYVNSCPSSSCAKPEFRCEKEGKPSHLTWIKTNSLTVSERNVTLLPWPLSMCRFLCT